MGPSEVLLQSALMGKPMAVGGGLCCFISCKASAAGGLHTGVLRVSRTCLKNLDGARRCQGCVVEAARISVVCDNVEVALGFMCESLGHVVREVKEGRRRGRLSL